MSLIRSLRSRLREGPSQLAAALAASQALGLLRMAVVSRLLGPEIKGEAAELALATGLVASLLVFDAAWQLVQSNRDDRQEFQSSIQAIAVLRGIVTAIGMAIVVMILLDVSDRTELMLPGLVLCTMPIFESLVNLGPWNELRKGNYSQLAKIELVASFTGLAAAMICLVFLRSVWVVVVASVATSCAKSVASHLVGRSPYRLRIRRGHIREILGYSIPLIPAGLFHWVNSQSVQMVIFFQAFIAGASEFGIRSLGAYATVDALVLAPQAVFIKLMQSVVIARIADVKHDPAQLRSVSRRLLVNQIWQSLAIASVCAVAGTWVLRLCLGAEFAPAIQTAGLLCSAMALRLLRSFCYVSYAALGATEITVVGNAVRLVGLPAAIGATFISPTLYSLALSVVVAEFIAVVACGIWLSRRIPGIWAWVAGGAVLVVTITAVVAVLPY